MELQENLVVADRYRLVRMIGRGGMGSVWQAVHLSLDQPCAVKFIEGEVGNVADAHARFEREAKAAAALRSPNVVQILDHGVWAGRPYIAMELLEGEDLGRALHKAGGRLPPARILEVLEQVCRALTRAHAAGFVHRDLKPDNIFLTQDDDRLLVKILDFGVAKQTSQAIEGSNTRTGAMLGTPYYMSPEQAQGIKSVDARSDLWSLAVIVFQCLTGRLPFESEALGDLLVKIIVQPLPTPSQVAPVPPGFDAWWRRASDRNPDGRFPTAKDFAQSLAVALGSTAAPDTQRAVPMGTLAVGPPPGSPPPMGTGPWTPQPGAWTPPQGQWQPPGMATPQPAPPHGGSQPGAASSPVSFAQSGNVVPPRTSPALVVVLVAAFLALAGAGIFLLRGRTPKTPPGVATTAPPPSVAPIPLPDPTTPSTATPREPAPTAEPTAVAAVATPVPTTTARRTDPRPTATAAPPASIAKPPASAGKGWDPGF